ncbi:MAG: pentapeptide repeat-containing protein [Actinobacteria bacterium]|nr:pentapeptide repeat-containing protein [Actinomycetota bacterium]
MTADVQIDEPVIALPDPLLAGDVLEPHGDYDGVLFDAADLSGQRAGNARVTGSRFHRCAMDGVTLTGALLAECELDGITAADLDLSGARLRDVEIASARIGGLQAHDTDVIRVRFRGCRLGYVNLRAATLGDVVFERCVIADFDVRDASAQRVRFTGCTIERLSCPHATLRDVDLTGADIGAVSDPDGLRGVTISAAQLMVFASGFADHLGIDVVDVI